MNDLLDHKLEVSSICEELIKKSRKQYTAIAVLFSIISLIGIISVTYRIYIELQREFVPEKFNLNKSIYPFLMILYMLLSLFQLYYYFKAIANQKAAVDSVSQSKFETSFKYYVYGNRLNIASLALYLVIQILPIAIAFINN